MCLITRELRKAEYPLLETFLYESIFQRDPENPLPRNVIYRPELWVYIDRFGELPDDLCLCADCGGEIVGAVWTRIIPAYGHLDDETPEFAISLLPQARSRGVGTKLMRAMLEALRARGYRRASLSVQKDNYALKLYLRTGFEIIAESNEEYIMEYRF